MQTLERFVWISMFSPRQKRPDPFADEADEEENNPESETSEQTENYQSTETKQKDTPDLREEWYSPPHGSFI